MNEIDLTVSLSRKKTKIQGTSGEKSKKANNKEQIAYKGVWRSDFCGSWHLYGHSHGTLPDKNEHLSFDIGVGCHNFAPLSYEEVKAIMKTKNWTSPFSDISI